VKRHEIVTSQSFSAASMSGNLMEKEEAGIFNASNLASKTIANPEKYNNIEEAPTTKILEGCVANHDPVRGGFIGTPALSCISTSVRIFRKFVERIPGSFVSTDRNQSIPRTSVVRVCKLSISHKTICRTFLTSMI
jgi:hypothetical protein